MVNQPSKTVTETSIVGIDPSDVRDIGTGLFAGQGLIEARFKLSIPRDETWQDVLAELCVTRIIGPSQKMSFDRRGDDTYLVLQCFEGDLQELLDIVKPMFRHADSRWAQRMDQARNAEKAKEARDRATSERRAEALKNLDLS